MKRLLISSDNYLPRWDGIARFLYEVLPEISEEFETSLIVPDGKEKSTPKKVKKYSVELSALRVGDFRIPKISLRKISHAVKHNDIIFNQTLGVIGFFTLVIAKLKRKKIISYIHTIEAELVPRAAGIVYLKQILTTILRKLTKWMYNLSDLLIVPSEEVDEILTWMKVKTPRAIVNLGTNTEQFKPLSNEKLRKQLGIEKKDLVIGYHGRIAREKDITTLLRAFVRIRRKYSGIKLVIVGSGIKDLEQKIGKTQGVTHIPSTEQVNEYLNCMNIYVMPSLTETTCLSLLEAMSTELAVISTPVGYVEDYITEGVNGLIFPKSDSYELSKQIELLINNPKLMKKLGKNARKTVVQRFKWSDTSKKIVELIKNF